MDVHHGKSDDEFLAPILLDCRQDAGRDAAVEDGAELLGNLGGDPAAGGVCGTPQGL